MTEQQCTEVSAAAAMDSLALRLIARAAALRFGVAESAAELEMVYRLRCRVAIERGWARPENFPHGLERDSYDDHAVQIGAWNGAILIATCRLVPPTPGQPLPTEAAFGLTIQPPGRVLDVGRVCVAPEYRAADYRVLSGLLCQAWLEMRARGFTDACAILTPAAARMYRIGGLQVVSLGAPRLCWGEHRFPALVRPAASDHAQLIRTVLDPEHSRPKGDLVHDHENSPHYHAGGGYA